MIEILTLTTETCLVVKFSGKVTGNEYQTFIDALNERLKTRDRISLVVVLTDFEFRGDWDAARKDIKFGFGEYKHILRAALVGDQKWIKWFADAIGPFTKTEEKQFPEGQLTEAFNWACP